MNKEMIGKSLFLVAFLLACKSKLELIKGFILHKRGKNDEALETLEKATETDPFNTPAWKFKGVILSKYLGRYIESVEALNRSLEINPRDADVWYLKGMILARYLHNYEEAIEAFDRSLLLDPTDSDVWHHRFDALKWSIHKTE